MVLTVFLNLLARLLQSAMAGNRFPESW